MSGSPQSKISREKADIVLFLFLKTGDEDYITARWCATNNLTGNFFWHGAQTIEKYLKVILLLKGNSVKSHRHNLSTLYADVLRNCADILPKILKAHDVLRNISHGEMETEEFIRLMAKMGNASNRYLADGYSYKPEFLYWLDGLVFAMRKLIRDLYYEISDSSEGQNSATSNQTPIAIAPHIARPLLVGRLDSEVSSSFDSELRRAFLNRNQFFAPANYKHAKTSEVLVSISSSGAIDIFEMLKANDRVTLEKGIEFAEWLKISTHNGKEFEAGLNNLITKAVAKLTGN